MFDPAPVVERSADAASLPASQLLSPDRAVHVIIVQYIDEKVVLQRMTEYKVRLPLSTCPTSLLPCVCDR